jgi:hypothetical protein
MRTTYTMSILNMHSIQKLSNEETNVMDLDYPNEDIRMCVLDVQNIWTKSAIWNLNSKNWNN